MKKICEDCGKRKVKASWEEIRQNLLNEIEHLKKGKAEGWNPDGYDYAWAVLDELLENMWRCPYG